MGGIRRVSDTLDATYLLNLEYRLHARLGSRVLMVAALFLLILLILGSVVVPAYDLDRHF
jgi:hypothetical protein